MKPFIKWVGGKANIADQIAARMPDKIRTYVEPFVGGGAVFFAVHDRCKDAVLADTNEHLVSAFRTVRGRLPELSRRLRELEYEYNSAVSQEAMYYRVRDETPDGDLERAARLILLNRTGFNGLWRENKKRKMNTPWGKKDEVKLCDRSVFEACSSALAKASVRCMPFEKTALLALGPGDVLYMDPPYVGTFTAYQADPVPMSRLWAVARLTYQRGVKVIVSNADHPEVRGAFVDSFWKVEEIDARVAVGGAKKVRRELLIQSV